MTNLSDEMINRLRKLANKTTILDVYDENETVDLYSDFGGNIDDAYFGGQDDGEIYLAREILTALNIDWVKSA